MGCAFSVEHVERNRAGLFQRSEVFDAGGAEGEGNAEAAVGAAARGEKPIGEVKFKKIKKNQNFLSHISQKQNFLRYHYIVKREK